MRVLVQRGGGTREDPRNAVVSSCWVGRMQSGPAVQSGPACRVGHRARQVLMQIGSVCRTVLCAERAGVLSGKACSVRFGERRSGPDPGRCRLQTACGICTFERAARVRKAGECHRR